MVTTAPAGQPFVVIAQTATPNEEEVRRKLEEEKRRHQAPPVDKKPAVEGPAPVHVAPPVDKKPAVEAPAPVHVAPPIEKKPAAETPAPVHVAPPVEKKPAVEAPAPVHVAPPIEKKPAAETPAPVHVAPPVEKKPAVETPAPVHIAPPIEKKPAAETPAPVHVAPPVDKKPAVETPAPVHIAPPIEKKPAAEAPAPVHAPPPAAEVKPPEAVPLSASPVPQVRAPTAPQPTPTPAPVQNHPLLPTPVPGAPAQLAPVAPAPGHMLQTAPAPVTSAAPPAGVRPVNPVVPAVPVPVNPQTRNALPQPGGVLPKPTASTMAPPTIAPQPGQAQQPPGNQPKRNGVTLLEAGAIGAAVGLVGGMIIGEQARGLSDVQSQRRTVEGGDATYYSEPGRVIVREGDGLYVRHDETERFREFGTDVRVEQRGNETYQYVDRPDRSRIITITDRDGQLLKRIRRLPDGDEIVLIDNSFRPRPQHYSEEVIVIEPPPRNLPSERYEIDAASSDEVQIYNTLVAPPLAPLPRRYTLDEVRNSRDLRQYVRSVDLTAITFETGSWTIENSEIGSLQAMADAINKAITSNPREIFLIEGHTDAVGSDVDNLSLSDRRAQSVATILTRNFNVPPENLTTQGYGSQFLKIQTSDAERQNRRVTIRRVTPFLADGAQK